MKTVHAIHINELDNCVTLTGNAETGDVVSYLENDSVRTVTARVSIPIWHKIAIRPIPSGSEALKYGAVIGVASENIETGDHVHVHNVRSCARTL